MIKLFDKFRVSNSRPRRPRARYSPQWSLESLEPRIVLTTPAEAIAALDSLAADINNRLSGAGSDANSFMNQLESTVTTPLVGGPFAPLTAEFANAAQGTSGAFQSAVNSTIGSGQSFFNSLSSTVAGWMNPVVTATVDVGGGTWYVWGEPAMGMWGANYHRSAAGNLIDFQTDYLGSAWLTVAQSATSTVGDNLIQSSVWGTINRSATGAPFSGDAGFSRTEFRSRCGDQQVAQHLGELQ